MATLLPDTILRHVRLPASMVLTFCDHLHEPTTCAGPDAGSWLSGDSDVVSPHSRWAHLDTACMLIAGAAVIQQQAGPPSLTPAGRLQKTLRPRCARGLHRETRLVVQRHHVLETAWGAHFSCGSPGRTIVVNSEMDALPGIRHACGNNLIAIAGVATACVLHAAME
ncbi:hypothetical protein PsYK624_058320 [Phanerochaete sordida]|uniref:Uncharacterized protein n=1 Tax=Phanerochaete sordida TaxID=48140 RepID=A0A9P3LBQ7_9APHY|nr:hypothetical protein PsYK624_058320 [Phanerochaete sordida]